jgi:tetratricopeptide (TPR) repeat protein
METKPTPKSTSVSRYGRKKIALAIIGVVLVFGGVSLSIYALVDSKQINTQQDQQVPQQNTEATTVPEAVLSQDPLNSTAPTGKQLEDKVAQTKEQITKLESEIASLGAPQNTEQQVTLAIKYVELANLYIVVMDYPSALKAVANVYNPAIITQETLLANQNINMDAQGTLGLALYNMGDYQGALDAYNKALTIASLQAPYEGADVFSPAGVIKYTQAIKTVQGKV